jgi:hypothetical protein
MAVQFGADVRLKTTSNKCAGSAIGPKPSSPHESDRNHAARRLSLRQTRGGSPAQASVEGPAKSTAQEWIARGVHVRRGHMYGRGAERAIHMQRVPRA